MSEQQSPLLEAIGVKKDFILRREQFWKRPSVLRALDGISFRVHKGETLGLVGESGSGKSTAGRIAIGLLEPSNGVVKFEGQSLTELRGKSWRRSRQKMQMVFQNPADSLDPRIRVGDQISEVIAVHRICERHERSQMALDALAITGLAAKHVGRRFPFELSGGQLQRVVIARALVMRPKLIVCDEPVSALDVSVQAQVINLLQDLQRDLSLSYIFISHDLRVVRQISQRIAVMYFGRIVESAGTAELFKHPEHPYTRTLIASVAGATKPPATDATLIHDGGRNPVEISGCPFHKRCPLAIPRCEAELPQPRSVARDHEVACHIVVSR